MRAFKLKNGFSLVELLLVVSLLGILGISAIVMFPSMSETHLTAAIEQVRADIEYAKERAMLSNSTTGVQFISGGNYTVYDGTTATPIKSPLDRQDLIVNIGAIYPGISVSTNYTIEFDGFGAPTTGGGGSVTLSDGTNTRVVSVLDGSGKVAIQ